MCGRYRLSRRKQLIAEYFDINSDVDWEPRYNIAPSQSVGIIWQDPSKPERHLSLAGWGLIPSWAKDASIGSSTINALGDCHGQARLPRCLHAPPVFDSCRWVFRVAA